MVINFFTFLLLFLYLFIYFNRAGDSALHDAIGKENSEVVELLCNVPSLDLTIRNKRGFNCLHHASLKGNVVCIIFFFNYRN
jgi:ankyrin repeat protein